MPVINFKSPRILPSKYGEACRKHLMAVAKALNDVHPRKSLLELERDYFNHPHQFLLAIGKNALDMALTARELSDIGFQKACVLQPEGYYSEEDLKLIPDDWMFFKTSHPLPDQQTVDATKQVIRELQNLPEDWVIHCFISGGASSSFCLPEMGLSLEQYNQIVINAMKEGFDIYRLNAVRSLIDQVKGGKLSAMVSQIRTYVWAVSDILDDNPAYIGSGPLTHGITIPQDVGYWLKKQMESLSIRYEHLFELFSMAQEPNALHQTHLVVTRSKFVEALSSRLEKEGFNAEIVDLNLSGTVTQVASQIMDTIASFAKNATQELRKTLIWMGEPTIELSEQMYRGKGGRISALSVLMAERLLHHPNIVFIGLATDGKDGSSPDSGYFVFSETATHFRPLGGAISIIKKGNSGKALSSLGYGFSLSGSSLNLTDLYMVIFV